jgi:DNA-directed RNA polymerase subunit RPC12/RpoP
MDRRNLILGGVAALLILVAIVYYVTRPGATAGIPSIVKVNCVCLACKQQVGVNEKLTEPRPYRCPRCGERAAYPLFYCRDCGAYFVPNLVPQGGGEPPALPMIPSCPSCSGGNVGAYTGDETIPSEELVLPEWPQ